MLFLICRGIAWIRFQQQQESQIDSCDLLEAVVYAYNTMMDGLQRTYLSFYQLHTL
jgi:hypothetical protein